MLNKPTFFQLILSLIFTNLRKNDKYNSYPPPIRIGEHQLVHEINKEYGAKNYASGIYKSGKRKVFIKTWFGRVRDLKRFSLFTEYFANKILYKKLGSFNSTSKAYKIKVPKIIGYVQEKESLSLIFEYVEGKTLTAYPIKKQVEIFSAVINHFHIVSHSFNNKEKKYVLNITKKFYLFSLPLLTLVALISKPDKFKPIIRAFIDCIKSGNQVSSSTLYLTHCDLEPHNIIVNKSIVYVIDWGRAVFTFPDFDINHLFLNPDFKALAKELFNKLNIKPNLFLTNYISLQFASYPDSPKFPNYYLKNLLLKYA